MVLLSAFAWSVQNTYPVIKHHSFGKGEVLQYEVEFAFFTVGKAVTKIDDRIYRINSRPCYKIDAYGETSGLLAWVTKVDDQWGAYIDTAALVTHVAYRKLKEGRYRKNELVTFDHQRLKAEVKVMDMESGVYGEPKVYDVPRNVRDLVGGFMYLRVIDFSKVNLGDTLTISGFFEDQTYHLKIMYMGKEIVETNVGKIRCHRLVPIMPDNKLFDGENSITCWISDDENKIPVKIEAEMFIGSTSLELTGFKGLRNQLKIIF